MIISLLFGNVSGATTGATSMLSFFTIGGIFADGIKVDGACMLALTSSGDNVLTQLKHAHLPTEQINI